MEAKESFAAFAARMGIKDDKEGMLTQAKQLWEMLDDMAASNPDGYKKFIEKQMKDAEKMEKETAAPTPRFGLEVKQKKPSACKVVVNISESERVKAPEDGAAMIPMAVNPPISLSAPSKIAAIYEVIMNPKVFAEMDKDDEYRTAMCDLAIESLERKFNLQFDVKYALCEPATPPTAKGEAGASGKAKSKGESGATGKGAKGAAAAAAAAENITMTPSSLLQRLTRDAEDEESVLPGLATSAPPAKGKAPLIEEVDKGKEKGKENTRREGSGGAAAVSAAAGAAMEEGSDSDAEDDEEESGHVDGGADSGSSLPTPEHTITSDDNKVTVTVPLPGLSSAADIDLDVTDSSTLSLFVPGRYSLTVALPGPVAEDAIAATWIRDRATLVVTIPRS